MALVSRQVACRALGLDWKSGPQPSGTPASKLLLSWLAGWRGLAGALHSLPVISEKQF